MGFEKPSRELYLGEILNQTFGLYSSKFLLFFVPFLFAGLLSGLWNEIVSLMFPPPVAPAQDAPLEIWVTYTSSLLGVLIVTIVLTIIIGWIISTVASGMAVTIASDTLENREPALSQALNSTVERLFSLLGAGIVTGILIAVGLMLLVVPGVILAIMFSLVVPAIIIERAGALESLSRSRRLVGGRWLKTFGLLLVTYVIVGVAGIIFGFIGLVLDPVGWIASSILGALVAPIPPIAMTLYYYSMIAREQLASEQVPQPPIPPV